MSASRSLITMYDVNVQDWQRLGNYYNYEFSLRLCPSLKLLPFDTPNVNTVAGLVVDTFEIRGITINNGVKTYTGTNESLDTALVLTKAGVTYTRFYYLAEADQAEFTDGIYEYYVKITDGADTIAEFRSEPFCYGVQTQSIAQDGDFDERDFDGDDFFLNITGGSGAAFDGCVLSSSILPNVYPEGDFIDKMYFNRKSFRIVRKGSQIFDVLTDERFQTVNDPEFKFQRVQSLIYSKYEIEIMTSENNNIEIIEFAENLIIEDKYNNSNYKARIVSGTFRETTVADTQLRVVSFEFYDVNPANYGDNQQPVSNFLGQLFGFGVNTVRIFNSDSLSPEWDSIAAIGYADFKTRLMPKRQDSTPEVDEDIDGAKIEKDSRINVKAGYLYTLYLSNEQAQQLKTYAPMATSVRGLQGIVTKHTSIQKPVVTVSDIAGAVDLYKVEVLIPDENIDYMPYYE